MDIYSSVLKMNQRYSRRMAMSMTMASGEVRKYTYEVLLTGAEEYAEKLKVAGISKGDRVILVAENGADWQIAFLAIMKMNATAVLIDATLDKEVLVACIHKADARCILTTSQVKEKIGVATQYRVPILNIHESCKAFKDSYSVQSPFMTCTEDPMLDVAILFFEGTKIQEVKGLLFTHEALMAQVQNIAEENAVSRSERILSVIPNSRIEGMVACVLMAMLTGASIHYVEALTVENLERAFKVLKPTVFPAPQGILKSLKEKLIRQLEGQRFDATYLERCEAMRQKSGIKLGSFLFKTLHEALGGRLELIWCYEPMDEAVMRFYYALGFDILRHYGRSETNVPVLGNRDNEVTLDTCGKPYPDIEIQLMRPNEEGIGEMYIKSPYGMKGYFRDEALYASQYEDGWFKTGDLAKLEASGNVKFYGKLSDETTQQTQPNEVIEASKEEGLLEDGGLPNKDQWAYYWFKAWKMMAQFIYKVDIKSQERLPEESGYIIYSPFETSKGYLGLSLGYSKAQFFKFGYLTNESPRERFKVEDEAYGKIHLLAQEMNDEERGLCQKQLAKGWGIIIKAPRDAINAEMTDEVMRLAKEAHVPIIPAYLDGEEALFSGKEDRPKLFDLRHHKRYGLNLRYGKPIWVEEESYAVKKQIQEAFTALIENHMEEEIPEEMDELTKLALELLSPEASSNEKVVAEVGDIQAAQATVCQDSMELEHDAIREAHPPMEQGEISKHTEIVEQENAFEHLDFSLLDEEEDEEESVDLGSLLATQDIIEPEQTKQQVTQENRENQSVYEEEITFEASCLSKASEE